VTSHRERSMARALETSLDMCFATAVPKGKFRRKKLALSGASNQRKQSGTQIYVYKCDHCGCWHLTKQPPVEER
jgi:hypothetical protein